MSPGQTAITGAVAANVPMFKNYQALTNFEEPHRFRENPHPWSYSTFGSHFEIGLNFGPRQKTFFSWSHKHQK